MTAPASSYRRTFPNKRRVAGRKACSSSWRVTRSFRVNRTFYEQGLTLAGQVHSHPADAYHSDTDDAYPLMTLIGGTLRRCARLRCARTGAPGRVGVVSARRARRLGAARRRDENHVPMSLPRFLERVVDAAAPALGGLDRDVVRAKLEASSVTLQAGARAADGAGRAGFLFAANLTARLYPSINLVGPEELVRDAESEISLINPRARSCDRCGRVDGDARIRDRCRLG